MLVKVIQESHSIFKQKSLFIILKKQQLDDEKYAKEYQLH
jgi:hypothetical protein